MNKLLYPKKYRIKIKSNKVIIFWVVFGPLKKMGIETFLVNDDGNNNIVTCNKSSCVICEPDKEWQNSFIGTHKLEMRGYIYLSIEKDDIEWITENLSRDNDELDIS